MMIAYWWPRSKKKSGPGMLLGYTGYDRRNKVLHAPFDSYAEAKKYCKENNILMMAI